MSRRHHSQCFLTDHHEGPCQYMTVSDGVKPCPAPEPRAPRMFCKHCHLEIMQIDGGWLHSVSQKVYCQITQAEPSAPPAVEPQDKEFWKGEIGLAAALDVIENSVQAERCPECNTSNGIHKRGCGLSLNRPTEDTCNVTQAYPEARAETPQEQNLCATCGQPENHMNHDLPYGDLGTHAFDSIPAAEPPNYGLSIKYGDPRYEQIPIVGAGGDAEEIASERKLLELYRQKRAVDGLNGREWHASKHYEADQEITKLEAALGQEPGKGKG